jgi:2-hydroxychromene-2-carboxylate isomerase
MTQKRTIDFYFSFISLYTYIGYEAFQDLVNRHDLDVNYKPIDLHAVFSAGGGLPVSKRPPQRQAYRFVEMQRWRLARTIPLVLKPKHHPSDPVIGHRMLLAALKEGSDVRQFVGNALKILWVNDLDIQDPKVMVQVANQSGLKGDALLEKSHDAAIQADIDSLTQEAVERQVFGTPFFFYRDEPFWGQDRLEMLEDMIRSNREPIPFKIIESA